MNALAKDYAGFETDKAFRGDDGTYKVNVSKGDDKLVLFYSSKGALIKSGKATAKAKSEQENPVEPPK